VGSIILPTRVDRYAGKTHAAKAIAVLLAVAAVLPLAPRPSVAAPTPSFACSGTLSPDQAAICSDLELANLDLALDAQYRRLLSELAPAQQQEWQASEADWMKHRGECGDDKVCLRKTYLDRIDVINRKLEEAKAGPSAPAVAPPALPAPARPAAAALHEIGQSCTKGSQCRTGFCEYHGSKGYVCAVKTAAPAAPRLREIGQSCSKGSQCGTGYCEYHGSKGYVCAVKTAQTPNAPASHAGLRDIGQSCTSGSQCRSQFCEPHGSKGSVCAAGNFPTIFSH